MENRTQWSSRIGFIMAATGSAVGLGSIWKFPYITWKNGGGLFILVYLICILLVAIPIMIAEIVIGKKTQKEPYSAFKKLGGEKSVFRYIGLLGVLSGFTILSYYAVITGWSLEYQFKSLNREFSEINISQITKILNNIDKTSIVNNSSQNDLEKQIINSQSTISKNIQQDVFISFINKLLLSNNIKDIHLLQRFRNDANIEVNKNIDLKDKQIKYNLEQKYIYYQENNSIIKVSLFQYWVKYALHQKIQSEGIHSLKPYFLASHISLLFQEFINNPKQVLFWHFIVILLLVIILMLGVNKGIEIFSIYGMSLLFVIMIILMFLSLSIDSKYQALSFLTIGDSSKLTWISFLEALGHAFFTLSLGMGAMITYGSYLNQRSNIISTTLTIALCDTIISIAACLVIFPLILVTGLEPLNGGIDILFTALPLQFINLKGGYLLSFIFYFLILLAAISSALSLLEVVVAFLVEKTKYSRKQIVISSGIIAYIMGIPSAYNLNILSVVDFISATFMLPIGAFFIAIFVGYQVNFNIIKKEFKFYKYSLPLSYIYLFFIRYISPLCILVIIIQSIYEFYK